MFCTMSYLHPVKCILHFLFPFTGLHLEIDQRKFHILEYIELIDKIEALEDEADISFAENRPVAFPEICHLGTVKNIAARGRIVKQTKDIQER